MPVRLTMSVHGTKRTSSDVRLVSFSGAQRKWDFGAAKAAFDPKRTFCRLDLYRKIAYAWPKASGNSMRRREFVGLIGGAAAWPGWAYAQQARTYTVGVLTSNSPNPEPLLKALREGLHDAGYVEGGNLRLKIRSAAGTPDLLLEKAAELVRLKVDLIVTFFTPAALAAKKATGDVPIVMAGAGDPVASGLVASLTRPGGNVTGQSSAGAEVAGKSVELIRELIPTAHRLGVLVEESDPFAKSYVAEIRQAALSAGMEIEVIMIRSELSQEATFKDLADKPLDGLVIQGSIVRKEILDLAMKHRLPTVTSTRLGPSLGALMSYGSDYFELARQSAVYVDKILKGAKPADLPVAFPTKFLLIINATTAKALGLNISPMMLGRADEVIE